MNTHTMPDTLPTLRSAFARDAAYWGERGEWLIAYTTQRDADTLNRSNWSCFLKLLGGEGETVAIERASHWACGWVEYLVIDPSDAARVAKAQETLASLDGYPVVNEDHWSTLEHEEYTEAFRQNCRREVPRALADFALSERAVDAIEAADPDTLQTWFESLISSGEYHTGDTWPRFEAISHYADRDSVARLLREIRRAKGGANA